MIKDKNKITIYVTLIIGIYLLFTTRKVDLVSGQGKSCGNGVCQSQGGGIPENCSSCPQDCGVCPIPTTTPVPTSQLSPTPIITTNPVDSPTPTVDQNESDNSDSGNKNDQQGSASLTNTPTPTPFPNDPPVIEANFPGSFTINKSETITGAIFPSDREIEKAQISIDGGDIWTDIDIINNQFSHDIIFTEDGVYEIVIRATDIYGNTGNSDKVKITFDSLPPILGGAQFTYGSVPLNPVDNTITFIENVDLSISLSTKGGVTNLEVTTDGTDLMLEKIKGTQIFQGKIKYNSPGTYILKVKASDEVNDPKTRNYFFVNIVESGRVISSKENGDITISIYYYDSVLKDWFLWDGRSYSQENPYTTNEGKYSFILPPGSYYLELVPPKGRKYQSEIFKLTENTIINSDIDITFKDDSRFYNFLSEIPFVKKIIPPVNFELDKKENDIQKTTLDEFLIKDRFISDFIVIQNKDLIQRSLLSYINRPTLITYTSSWSILSQEQIRVLSEISKEIKNINVIVVSSQEPVSLGESIKLKGKYDYTTLSDKDGRAGEEMLISVLPYHFIVNSKGYIVSTLLGFKDKKELVDSISNLD